MNSYRIIKRESKTGINLRVNSANRQQPWGFEVLEGYIQAENVMQATAVLKQIIKDSLVGHGFIYPKEVP